MSITLDDLPKHSPWPARLLGITPVTQRRKTPAEVTREFDGEKWGPLRDFCSSNGRNVGLDEADEWVYRDVTQAPRFIQGEFSVAAPLDTHRQFRDWVAEVLAGLMPMAALVELGCGYGSVLLDIARRPPFRGLPVVAAEYTASGAAATALLAEAEGLLVTVGRCDFRQPGVTDLTVPPGSVIFTSSAAMYVPELANTFVDSFLALRPKAVVHFEPCHEHARPDSMLGLLLRRYIEVNDYNRNLVTLLKARAAAGDLQLQAEQPIVFGTNPLLPVSLLVWSPAP
jgi:hypothetical protein